MLPDVARKETQKRSGGTVRTVSPQWILVVVALALAGTIVAAVRHHNGVLADAAAAAADAAAARPAEPAPQAGGGRTVPIEVMNDLTSIPSDTWRKVGTQGGRLPVFVGTGVTTGKPVVLYIGAGYCPYCAAARWSLIAALSRFGTFSGLTYGASSSVDVFPRTPTFSFHGARYASRYIELQTVEESGDEPGPDGHYPPLEQATFSQDALIRKYDVPPYVPAQGAGGIPFILVAQRYMWSGSPFSPQVLAGRSQADIAAALPTMADVAAQAILVNANVFTAAICAVTRSQPADVCSDPVIQRTIAALPTKIPS
jgi:Domain of unknown function (DUF929)